MEIASDFPAKVDDRELRLADSCSWGADPNLHQHQESTKNKKKNRKSSTTSKTASRLSNHLVISYFVISSFFSSSPTISNVLVNWTKSINEAVLVSQLNFHRINFSLLVYPTSRVSTNFDRQLLTKHNTNRTNKSINQDVVLTRTYECDICHQEHHVESTFSRQNRTPPIKRAGTRRPRLAQFIPHI